MNLPPPGPSNIIVRTPNPLPAPTSIGKRTEYQWAIAAMHPGQVAAFHEAHPHLVDVPTFTARTLPMDKAYLFERSEAGLRQFIEIIEGTVSFLEEELRKAR